jgi:SAM-dependent methyltransferase
MKDIMEEFVEGVRLLAKKHDNIELECRFQIDKRQTKAAFTSKSAVLETISSTKVLLKSYLDDPKYNCKIEQTLNFIKQLDNKAHIKQLHFTQGVQDKKALSHYSKLALAHPLFIENALPYKITVSQEKKEAEFPPSEATLARFKLRFTVEISESWRLDCTLIKNVTDFRNPLQLKSVKDSIIYKLDINKFVELAPWETADQIELELEYINDLSKFSIEELITQVAKVSSYYVSKHTTFTDEDMLQHAAKRIVSIIAADSPYQRNKTNLTIKQISNAVIELDANLYTQHVLPYIDDFYITDKVDGKRTLVLVDSGSVYYLSDTLNKENTEIKTTYLFDTEFYDGKYYVFDVLCFDGKQLSNADFSQRLTYIDKITADLKKSLHLEFKPFVRLNRENYKEQINKLQREKKLYETDGIIFNSAKNSYQNMAVYKYKPLEKLTTDFLIKLCPTSLLNITPYMKKDNLYLYLLFCGVSKAAYFSLNLELIRKYDTIFPHINPRSLPAYFPIQFEPSDTKFAYLFYSDNPNLDNKVGEFRINNYKELPYNYTWELVKLREDREEEVKTGHYFGNNYKVAELNWMSYQSPLDINKLTDSYFKEADSSIHKDSRNFNSFVKTQIIQQFAGAKSALDLASGKGQDLFRYIEAKISTVLFVEIDGVALLELIQRKHGIPRYKFRDSSFKPETKIMIQRLDLLEKYKKNIEILANSRISAPTGGFEFINCNFAFHYFCESKENILNVLKFVKTLLKEGGRFVFTAFSGHKVHDLLIKHKGNWTTSDNKYSIIQKYKESEVMPHGQKIDVLLPFSDKKYYSEYLVNIEYIEAEANKLGLILESSDSFGTYLPKYNSKLREEDAFYTSLYYVYCFYKSKTVVGGKKFKKVI